MKSPQQVWHETAQDDRWLDDPVAMLERVMREAFAGGFRVAIELGHGSVTAHADGLARNLSLRLPGSVAKGMHAVGDRLFVLADDAEALKRAWFDAMRTVQLVPQQFLQPPPAPTPQPGAKR